MKNLVIYIHGKGGNADEALHYKSLFPDCDVIGFDYKSNTPWDAKKEFSDYFDSVANGYDEVYLIANSIGAFFSMNALAEKPIKKAFFISPMVNLEKLICDMMMWAGISEKTLREKKEIATDFGENLSWEYLCYVRENPIEWRIPTQILYGSKDNLTTLETMQEFANKAGATLTVMEGGEHWFHTEEQMEFLDRWITGIK
ncbi:MAG: alpha/beta hydrolase [Fibrobacter sp.]|uniref:alpha/beta hydrolase n=1 Tax=Fibrobacter sp. TaxID=35828 RepID=UPI0025C58A40|nr:alpha/beta hydrolase [Fibrobacter sp.]MBR4784551.1 alpha/beta hydrolase [Fibrobacter sp.]